MGNGIKAFWIIVFTIILFSCGKGNEPETFILDVKAIVNKDARQVENVLGKPDSVYNLQVLGKSIYCQWYRKNGIEIQYPESLATDILVRGPHGLPFNQMALASFNLDYKKIHPSDYKKNGFIRWSNFGEFSAITFYNPKLDSLKNITAFEIFFKAKPGETRYLPH